MKKTTSIVLTLALAACASAGPAPRDEATTDKITFLGVACSPADESARRGLNLSNGAGLVVDALVPDSPAAATLKEGDILYKFDDQLLINGEQLATLVRNRNAGDKIQLTAIRDRTQIQVSVELASRQAPPIRAGRPYPSGMPPPAVRSLQDGPGRHSFRIDLGENTQPGRDQLLDRLQHIIIPEIDFRQANIEDVLQFLRQAGLQHDPRKKGVNLILNLKNTAGDALLLTFAAKEMSVMDAIKIVTELADLQYRVASNYVMIEPRDDSNPQQTR